MQKVLLIISIVFFIASCNKSTDPISYNNATNEYTYFNVSYNGAWSGNVISNNNFIYPISNYGSLKLININGLAIKKNDITKQVLSLTKTIVIQFDNGRSNVQYINRVSSGTNIIGIE